MKAAQFAPMQRSGIGVYGSGGSPTTLPADSVVRSEPPRGRRARPSNSATWLRRKSVPSVALRLSWAMLGISSTLAGGCW